MGASPDNFGSNGFGDIVAVNVSQTKFTMINTLDNFTNAMRLFQDDIGEEKKSVELQNIRRQKRGIGRIRRTHT